MGLRCVVCLVFVFCGAVSRVVVVYVGVALFSCVYTCCVCFMFASVFMRALFVCFRVSALFAIAVDPRCFINRVWSSSLLLFLALF